MSDGVIFNYFDTSVTPVVIVTVFASEQVNVPNHS